MNRFLSPGLLRNALFALLATAPCASASVFLTSTGSYPGVPASDLRNSWAANGYAGTKATNFTVGPNAILITAFGYYDGPNTSGANVSGYTADGLANSHTVGIFDTAQNLLGSTTVASGGSSFTINDFTFVPVTPFTLNANTSYLIAAQVRTEDLNPGGDLFRTDDGNGVYSLTSSGGGIGSVDWGNSFSGPPTNPTYSDGVFTYPNSFGGRYIAGNFQYTSVPEPRASFLVLAASVAFVLIRRNKR